MNEKNKKQPTSSCNTNSMITALAVLIAIVAVFFAGMMYAKSKTTVSDAGGSVPAELTPPSPTELYRSLAKDAGLSDTQVEECLAPASDAQKTVIQHMNDAQKMGVNGTPGSFLVNTKTNAVRSIPGALPITEVERLLEEISNDDTASEEQLPEGADLSLLQVRENDIVKGNADILLIEYSDYECPFCGQFHPTAQALADSGKVKWIYRHLPLPFHPTAKEGAIIGDCVRIHRGMRAAWTYTDGVFKGLQ